MANDDTANVGNPGSDADSKPAEETGAIRSGESIEAKIGALVVKEARSLLADIADTRMSLAPVKPMTVDDRLAMLEADRDALVNGLYWGAGIIVFLLIIGGMRRGY